jgi:ABC-2 type transport system permease protein
MLCGMLIQLSRLLRTSSPACTCITCSCCCCPIHALVAVLAIAVQVLVNNKYLGYFAMILYIPAIITLRLDRLRPSAADVRGAAGADYSAMNGFGHYLARKRWFELYWAGAALVLLVLSLVFWPRGNNAELAQPPAAGAPQPEPPVLVSGAAGLLLFGALGATLYYQMHVAGYYRTWQKDRCAPSTNSATRNTPPSPQPRIAAVNLRSTSCRKRGAWPSWQLPLDNRSGLPVSDLFGRCRQGRLPGCASARTPRRCWPTPSAAFTATAWPPLAPGAKHAARLRRSTLRPTASSASAGDTPVVANGTFFSNDILPHIGYQSGAELTDDRDRKRHGLAARAPHAAARRPGGRPTTLSQRRRLDPLRRHRQHQRATRSRSRRARWRRNGSRAGGATSTTGWTSRS